MARRTTAASGGAQAEGLAQVILGPPKRKGAANDRPLTVAELLYALAPLKTMLEEHDKKMRMMEVAIQRIAQVDTLGTRVENGLCEIAEKLKPLESLRAAASEPEPLKAADKKNLDDLIGSLKRAEWSNATSIPVPNKPVPFVGQTPPRQGSNKL